MTKLNKFLSRADDDQQILISDGGCDQTLITSNWTVTRYTGRKVTMIGAFAGRNVGQSFPVVSAECKLTDEAGTSYIAVVHEALYDANVEQVESLLSVHQSLRMQCNGIDDRSRSENNIHGNPGTQCARFMDIMVPFFFDGTKCFYEINTATPEESRDLPRIVLTDETPYDPKHRVYSRKVSRNIDIMDWKQRLGFAPDKVILKTLEATTQLVPSLETETK